MNELSPLHVFSENTRYICIIISFSLIILIFTYASVDMIGRSKLLIIKLISIVIIYYALIINYRETNKLVNSIPDIFINENLTNVRNNVLLSYILCIMILIFVVYMLYIQIF